MRATVDRQNWVRCGNCGHKLCRVLNMTGMGQTVLEIKCHSCKAINVADAYIKKDKKYYSQMAQN